MSNDDQTPKDEGSMWASYSDLFTNVAIIFLVMFVFALLKSGISKLETAVMKKQHANELKGKLSDQEVYASLQKVKKVEDSIQEMQKVETLVDQKMQEIQQFAKNMEQNKQVLKELIEEQKKKDSLLNTVNQKITEKEQIIQQLSQQSQELTNQIQQNEKARQELEQTIAQKQQISQKDQEKMLQLQNNIQQLQQDKLQKEQEVAELKRITGQSSVSIAQLEQQKQELEQKLVHGQMSFKQLEQNKSHLEQRMADLSQSKIKLERSLQELQQQTDKSRQTNDALTAKLGDAQSKQAGLEEAMKQLNRQLDNKIAEANHLKGMHEKSLRQVASMNGQLEEASQKMKNLAKALQEMKGKLRSSVADALKRKFGALKMQVAVDSESGTIILEMNDDFQFKKNSFDLSDKAQATLSKITPIYAEVIFGDPSVSSKVESIEITGHASPSFKKNFVDPKGEHPEAYAHNMRLSAQRAASVANYMMGKKIGQFAHKEIMRESLFAIGRSYISPLQKSPSMVPVRGPASEAQQDQECGPFDCSKSQRVEIGFRLKDDVKAIEKLINLAGAK